MRNILKIIIDNNEIYTDYTISTYFNDFQILKEDYDEFSDMCDNAQSYFNLSESEIAELEKKYILKINVEEIIIKQDYMSIEIYCMINNLKINLLSIACNEEYMISSDYSCKRLETEDKLIQYLKDLNITLTHYQIEEHLSLKLINKFL